MASSSSSSSSPMATSTICLWALIILSSSLFTNSDGRQVPGFHRVHMSIENDLTFDDPLTLHCRSKDNDIGHHVLAFRETLDWSFKPNVFAATTLFFCSMQWGGAGGVSASFEVYNENKDNFRCDQRCWWSIRRDGAYFFSEPKEEFELVHKW